MVMPDCHLLEEIRVPSVSIGGSYQWLRPEAVPGSFTMMVARYGRTATGHEQA
jgi:hypothetical protein